MYQVKGTLCSGEGTWEGETREVCISAARTGILLVCCTNVKASDQMEALQLLEAIRRSVRQTMMPALPCTWIGGDKG